MDKTVPVGAAILLDFIYRTDAGKAPPEAYQVIFGNRQNSLAKPITYMTLGELVALKRTGAVTSGSERTGVLTLLRRRRGAAQFMRATL